MSHEVPKIVEMFLIINRKRGEISWTMYKELEKSGEAKDWSLLDEDDIMHK
jgi:hypothetical protein